MVLVAYQFYSPVSYVVSTVQSTVSPSAPISVSSGAVIKDFATPTVVTLVSGVAQTVSPPSTARSALYDIPFLLTRGGGLAMSTPYRPNSFFGPVSA